ncbi:MAG TPA: amino acid--tRNA ligase-related protein, partial [Candidatus Paceibacterota bacterium]
PSEHFGIENIETRLRKRYLDLLVNPGVKEIFEKKAVFWETIRSFLKSDGFLEAATPVLESVPGGADAEPFVTHHNALDRDFYLRISLELPLKRLLVAGYEKVFEIGRVFRNEGIDREHLQEYDSLEFYWSFEDHEDGMKLVEKLYKEIVEKVTGGTKTKWENQELNWGGKWQKVDYFEAFKKEAGIDLNKDVQVSELKKKADELGIKCEKSWGKGRMIDAIYKKTVRQKLIQPCFLVGHPVEVSPLAKCDPENPRKVLRLQVLAAQSELGNGWAELNDPVDQRKRFEEQMKLRAAGDKEAQMLDEDFVEALEYGMPPAFGFGLSERLFAVLMNKPIREIVLFPPMRERG